MKFKIDWIKIILALAIGVLLIAFLLARNEIMDRSTYQSIRNILISFIVVFGALKWWNFFAK